jgi:hypothetical protein
VYSASHYPNSGHRKHICYLQGIPKGDVYFSLKGLSMSEERRIVVSIDFGTTFSGVAWADTTQVSPSSTYTMVSCRAKAIKPDVQHVLSDWPSVGSSQNSPKVPTELRKVASGWQWGFQIPKSAKRSRLFKL